MIDENVIFVRKCIPDKHPLYILITTILFWALYVIWQLLAYCPNISLSCTNELGVSMVPLSTVGRLQCGNTAYYGSRRNCSSICFDLAA